MKNKALVSVSAILLIISAVIMHGFVSGSKPIFDPEMIEFFTGLSFGIGIVLLGLIFLDKRKSKSSNL